MQHSTTAVTVKSISTSASGFKNPGDVDFEVKYSADYKGVKHMPEGVVTISKEAAEDFTKRGIGKVVEAKAEAASDKSDDAPDNSKKTGKGKDK